MLEKPSTNELGIFFVWVVKIVWPVKLSSVVRGNKVSRGGVWDSPPVDSCSKDSLTSGEVKVTVTTSFGSEVEVTSTAA